MPSGEMPSYSYRPVFSTSQMAQLRTCSERRGRVWAGGTFFRSRSTGLQQNNISIQMIEFAPPGSNGDAICVVTNRNVNVSENVVGKVKTSILSVALPYTDQIIIDQLHTTPRARNYSISAQIGGATTVGPSLPFTFSRIFSMPGLVSAKFTPTVQEFAETDTIVIKPRVSVYRLSAVQATAADGTPTSVWSIDDLRAQINQHDPWIEMPERPVGGTPADVQDTGADDIGLTPFSEVFLSGGDGLPSAPNMESTGPVRSIVHVNYGEAHNGALVVINRVYEWAGDTAQSGSWQVY